MPASMKLLRESLLKGPQKNGFIKGVYAKWGLDGLYYKIIILALNETEKSAHVRYEDGTKAKADLADIHVQLDLERMPDQEIICTICEGDSSEAPDQIVICEVCEQGYHQKCHLPNIPDASIDKDDASEIEIEWICHTCSYMAKQADNNVKIEPAPIKMIVKTRKSAKPEKIVVDLATAGKKSNKTTIVTKTTNAKSSKEPKANDGPTSIVKHMDKRRSREHPTRLQPAIPKRQRDCSTKGKDLDKTRKKFVQEIEDGLKKVIPVPTDFEGENNPLLVKV